MGELKKRLEWLWFEEGHDNPDVVQKDVTRVLDEAKKEFPMPKDVPDGLNQGSTDILITLNEWRTKWFKKWFGKDE